MEQQQKILDIKNKKYLEDRINEAKDRSRMAEALLMNEDFSSTQYESHDRKVKEPIHVYQTTPKVFQTVRPRPNFTISLPDSSVEKTHDITPKSILKNNNEGQKVIAEKPKKIFEASIKEVMALERKLNYYVNDLKSDQADLEGQFQYLLSNKARETKRDITPCFEASFDSFMYASFVETKS